MNQTTESEVFLRAALDQRSTSANESAEKAWRISSAPRVNCLDLWEGYANTVGFLAEFMERKYTRLALDIVRWLLLIMHLLIYNTYSLLLWNSICAAVRHTVKFFSEDYPSVPHVSRHCESWYFSTVSNISLLNKSSFPPNMTIELKWATLAKPALDGSERCACRSESSITIHLLKLVC